MRLIAIMTALLFGLLAVDMAVAKSRGVEAGKEAEQWAGVGILHVQGGSWCSAALLNPKTVITAAHCVYPSGSRNMYDPKRITFKAGWRDGITAASRQAVRIVAHRDYDPRRPYETPNIASDIAIVELDSPIEVDAAEPYGKIDKIRIQQDVSVVSFSGRRSDVASINEGCRFYDRAVNILMMTCESYPGMSGAPVFSFVNGRPKIVALISGHQINTQTGANNSIALAIDAPLGRVLVDAKATLNTPSDALPYWTKRSARPGPIVGVAERKTIGIRRTGGLSRLTGSGTARTVIRPPSN